MAAITSDLLPALQVMIGMALLIHLTADPQTSAGWGEPRPTAAATPYGESLLRL